MQDQLLDVAWAQGASRAPAGSCSEECGAQWSLFGYFLLSKSRGRRGLPGNLNDRVRKPQRWPSHDQGRSVRACAHSGVTSYRS